MTDLATLLSSQEARDAAPCVPVTGPWYLVRNGNLERVTLWAQSNWFETGYWKADQSKSLYDCIWSGDLVEYLAAKDAEIAQSRGEIARLKDTTVRDVLVAEAAYGDLEKLLSELAAKDAEIARLRASIEKAREVIGWMFAK